MLAGVETNNSVALVLAGPLYALAWSSAALPQNVASSSRYGASPRHSAASSSAASSPAQGSGGGVGAESAAAASIPRNARLAVGSFVDEYTNRIQVLGIASDSYGCVAATETAVMAICFCGTSSHHTYFFVFFRQPCLRPVADAAHPYPATRIAFQPPGLDDTSSSGASAGVLRYSALKPNRSRSSWGSYSGMQSVEGLGEEGVYPERELLATTADCLRIWECTREEDSGSGASSNYVGTHGQPSLPFALREKSVLAHVSCARSVLVGQR